MERKEIEGTVAVELSNKQLYYLLDIFHHIEDHAQWMQSNEVFDNADEFYNIYDKFGEAYKKKKPHSVQPINIY